MLRDNLGHYETDSAGEPARPRQQNDRLLEATAAVANILLMVESLDEAVHQALQIIGESLDADRINIIENVAAPSDPSFPGWRVLYEWDSPGTIPQLSNADAVQGSYKEIPEIFEWLQQGRTMRYLIEDAPEPFRSSQMAIGVKATCIVPIQVEGQWWGLVGLDDCQMVKTRSAAELAVLGVLANCVGSAIQRQRTQQAMLQAEQERVAELAKANEELQQRDRELQQSYRLLSTVAEVTKDLLENPQVEDAIVQALQRMGEAANISRVSLMQERPEFGSGRLQHHVTHEWTTAGIPKQIDDPVTRVVYNDEYGVLVDKLHAGRSIWHILDDLPEPARTQQADIAVKSTGAVPIFIEGKYFGAVGFDDCVTYRQWTPHEIDVLTSGAGAIGAALHRKQLVDCLVEERTRAAQERAAELAKANDVLRRSVAHLTTTDSLQSFLVAVLREAIQAIGAVNAAVFVYNPSSHTLQMTTLLLHDEVVDIATDPRTEVWRSPVPADITNAWYVLSQERRIIWVDNDNPPPEHWPPSQAWHRQLGHKNIAVIPLLVGEKALGFLGLCFSHYQPPNESKLEQCWTLSQHAALALELTRLADKADQAAVARLNEVIAREQEKAAQQQAAELSRANILLRNSLSRLSTEPDLNDVLGQLLIEVTRYADASVGHIFSYDAEQNTLTMLLRVRDEQVFWTPADDEPAIFRSPISVDNTPIFTNLCQNPRLATLNISEFEGKLWPGVPEWFDAKGIQATSTCVLMVGDRPVGLLGMAFPQPIALRLVDEELILALAQQIVLVMQLTTLAEAGKEAALLEERNRFARDIHDTIAQALTGIIVQLEAAKGVVATQPQVAHEHLTRASTLAREGLAEARRSVWALRPEALESQDLSTVLHHLVRRMTTGTTLSAVVQVTGDPFLLSPNIEMNLLRIGQEALTNVLRHAQAQTVKLTLHFASQSVRLDIVDDGQGFDPQQLTIDYGFGLIGMQERSQRLGGSFSLTSQPGLGTTISITVPTSGE